MYKFKISILEKQGEDEGCVLAGKGSRVDTGTRLLWKRAQGKS